MELSAQQLGLIIQGMRKAYTEGENAMAYARSELHEYKGKNHPIATLVAYDLQAGSYVESARENPEIKDIWCKQLAELIGPVLPSNGSLLEVGVGEATTLAGVLQTLGQQVGKSFGFDISWSRVAVAREWLLERLTMKPLWRRSPLNLYLADNSIDVVYSSHSLEPNGGREEAALQELLRVARHVVVLIEPIYELASPEAQARMTHHGYVRGLKETAEKLGASVLDYRLLEHIANPLNPSGVLVLQKRKREEVKGSPSYLWQCPLTATKLQSMDEFFYAPDVGVAYPILRGIPMLAPQHAIIASRIFDLEN